MQIGTVAAYARDTRKCGVAGGRLPPLSASDTLCCQGPKVDVFRCIVCLNCADLAGCGCRHDHFLCCMFDMLSQQLCHFIAWVPGGSCWWRSHCLVPICKSVGCCWDSTCHGMVLLKASVKKLWTLLRWRPSVTMPTRGVTLSISGMHQYCIKTPSAASAARHGCLTKDLHMPASSNLLLFLRWEGYPAECHCEGNQQREHKVCPVDCTQQLLLWIVPALTVVEVSQHWDDCGGCVDTIHDGRYPDPVATCTAQHSKAHHQSSHRQVLDGA